MTLSVRMLSIAIALSCAFFLFNVNPSRAESVFAPGEDFIEEVVLRDLPISTAIAFASTDRAYLALKVGIIRVVRNGALLSEPFLDISNIVNKATDRGLTGIAVDPQFPQKPFIYISYVYDPPGTTPDSSAPRVARVARITADAAKDYNVALPGSLEVIVGKNSTAANMAAPVPTGDANFPERASCMTGLTMAGTPIEDCIPCDGLSHSSGTLIFGSDRSLYASFGDGADYNGPNQVGLRTQNKDSMSGRIIRINPDTGLGLPSNPYYDATRPGSNISKLWSYGFRNPFRITLNPSNGQVYAGDVGTSYYEEINVGKGANFGWPCYEGGFTDRSQQEGEATGSIQQVGYKAHPRTVDFCNAMYAQGVGAVTKPLFTYRHPYDENGKDLGASVTGVAFYNGTSYPSKYKGALFFADYARLWIRYLTFDSAGRPTARDFATEEGTGLGAVELIAGPDSNIYAVYIDLETRTSNVRRFRYVGGGDSAPVVRASVSPQSGKAPLVVSLNASNSFDPDGQALSYEWSFGDGTKSTQPDTQHVYTKVGNYTATVTVKEKTAPFRSTTDSFSVVVGSSNPKALIVYPTSGSLFQIGSPVSFLGRVEGVSGEGVSLSWTILQVHNQHTHLVTEIEGASGSFIPTEHTDNTTYELCLVATTANGVKDQVCNRLTPRTSQHLFASEPPGAPIVYVDEETEVIAPFMAEPIVGSRQTIRAASVFGGRTFEGWSDGVSSATREFLTTTAARAFLARYRNRAPKASFGYAARVNSRGRRGRTVVFDASPSRDPEGESLQYTWRFPDRTRATGAVVRKRFRSDGRFRVRLTVADPLGGVARVTRTVTVRSRSSRR